MEFPCFAPVTRLPELGGSKVRGPTRITQDGVEPSPSASHPATTPTRPDQRRALNCSCRPHRPSHGAADVGPTALAAADTRVMRQHLQARAVAESVSDLGAVFATFDHRTQDSGNISYGVETPVGEKLLRGFDVDSHVLW